MVARVYGKDKLSFMSELGEEQPVKGMYIPKKAIEVSWQYVRRFIARGGSSPQYSEKSSQKLSKRIVRSMDLRINAWAIFCTFRK